MAATLIIGGAHLILCEPNWERFAKEVGDKFCKRFYSMELATRDLAASWRVEGLPQPENLDGRHGQVERDGPGIRRAGTEGSEAPSRRPVVRRGHEPLPGAVGFPEQGKGVGLSHQSVAGRL